jgi:outer membrane receptor protein involved in Fe transport
VPGLTVSRTGSPGKNTTLFIRGGSSKQALVLWNGVQINNPYFSGYDFGQLSAAGVERIEVVRGPFSALYGSEAVSGVVNVLTTPMRTRVAADLEGGENGLFNGTLYGAYVSERWNANGTIEHRQDDGYAPNDDFEATSLLGGITYTPADGSVRRGDGPQYLVRSRYAALHAERSGPSLRRCAAAKKAARLQLLIPLRFDRGASAFECAWSRNATTRSSIRDAPFGPQHDQVDSARAATSRRSSTRASERSPPAARPPARSSTSGRATARSTRASEPAGRSSSRIASPSHAAPAALSRADPRRPQR